MEHEPTIFLRFITGLKMLLTSSVAVQSDEEKLRNFFKSSENLRGDEKHLNPNINES